MPENCQLTGTVDRFEGKFAVIKTADGQKILWPIKNLPENATEGSMVKITLETDTPNQAKQEALAKKLLNEILKNDRHD